MKQRGPLGGELVRVQELRVQAELGPGDGGGGHGPARRTGGGGLVLRGERNLKQRAASHCCRSLRQLIDLADCHWRSHHCNDSAGITEYFLYQLKARDILVVKFRYFE